MPTLPSGLTLALSRHALIEHGEQWFSCPEGHFWYWDAAPEMGSPPFSLTDGGLQIPAHAPVPASRAEAAGFVRVLEMADNGLLGWRGEWLATFPRFRVLSPEDEAAWREWLDRPEVDEFLDVTLEKCAAMARLARDSSGHAVFRELPPDEH